MNKLTALIEAAKAATPGPWSTDTLENDGDYGQGPDDVHSGFKSYGVLSSHNRILFDSLNRDPSLCEVHEDTYAEHRYAWDELAKRDAKFIALANPATILELCALLEKAEEALKDAEGATAYASHDDSVGYRVCCQVQSYKPHEKWCKLNEALAAIKQWKEQT